MLGMGRLGTKRVGERKRRELGRRRERVQYVTWELGGENQLICVHAGRKGEAYIGLDWVGRGAL